ncbi:MAG: hypothetical protein HW419_1980 [Deltaproteobacteria bacterium]|nr:hypothetical protein [Deltaproteobacteria bacterium]
MSERENVDHLPGQLALPRRTGRPLKLGGGPQNYLQNALTAVAEPFKGNTADSAVISGPFPIRATGFSTQTIREAAKAYLGALNAAQRTRALFPVDAKEWRMWSNIHRTIMRHGIPFCEMSDQQVERAFALLKESFSDQGFATARDIMRRNETVMEMTGRVDEFGEDLYWLSIMGRPSAAEPWGWQIDGHHLNVNCFVIGDQIVMTPAFLGSEPVFAQSGKYAGTRVFEAEEAQGLAVIRALDTAQRGKAVVSRDLPRDLFTSAFHDNHELRYEGIAYDELTPQQHDQLLRLMKIHVGGMRPAHARVKMDEVLRYVHETHFSWRGGVEENSVFYYRIQSPAIIIEFDHQAGQAFPQFKEHYRDHIHIIVRTPNGNDYGKDLLRQHYQRGHHASGQ